MDPALVLEPRVRAASADQRDHFLDSAESRVAHGQHFELEAVALGVARVHAEEVAGKKRRFFAAGACANFQDYVLLVVRIARSQQLLELLFDGAEIFLQRRHLGLGQFAQVSVVAVEDGFVTGDFVGNADIFAGAMRSLGKLRSLIGELALEFRDPLFYCACLIEHRRSAPASAYICKNPENKTARPSWPCRWILPRAPGCVEHRRAAGAAMLLLGCRFRRLFGRLLDAVLAIEPLDAPRCIDQALRASVKRMALRADLDVKLFDRRARFEGVAARTNDRAAAVFRMDSSFHFCFPNSATYY